MIIVSNLCLSWSVDYRDDRNEDGYHIDDYAYDIVETLLSANQVLVGRSYAYAYAYAYAYDIVMPMI